ncbi:nitrile hydratase subunit alpha [Mycobacterium interjectum]|uniref:nitrile hydratase subunit alpha n=1 Tax=Mycobacterium interjectum TaxID=33895 RepID=UPI00083251ED|nr:nitrile hydratase subunit alpha [Mycobacterium interjectum]
MSRNHSAHTDAQRAHITARVAVLEQRLIERGAITGEQLDDILDTFTHRLGAHHGARYVARAWTDPKFKREQLTEDQLAALVTRDCLIGTTQPVGPSPRPSSHASAASAPRRGSGA